MRRRTLIQLALATLLLTGIFVGYGFWYTAVGKSSAEAVALDKEIQKKEHDSERARATKDALLSLEAEEMGMQNYLVRQDDIVPFLGALEQAGTSLGSVVEVLSVSAEPSDTRSRLLLSLKIAGTFDSVLRTLGSIEYGAYDCTVESITFDTTPGEEGAVWTAAATFSFGTQTP